MTDEPRIAPEAQTAEEREHARLDRLNRFRTSPVGVAMFYGYLLAIIVSGALVGHVILDNRRIASESHRGLCTLKAERVARVKTTEAILADPNKPENARIIETFGKPFIVRSLATSRADAKALGDVSC